MLLFVVVFLLVVGCLLLFVVVVCCCLLLYVGLFGCWLLVVVCWFGFCLLFVGEDRIRHLGGGSILLEAIPGVMGGTGIRPCARRRQKDAATGDSDELVLWTPGMSCSFRLSIYHS